MTHLKAKFNLAFSILCILGAFTVIGMYIVACTTDQYVEQIAEAPNAKVTEITSFEQLDSTLFECMYGSPSRAIDLPSWDDGSDDDIPQPLGYIFNNEEEGISAQISQSITDNTMYYCSFNTPSSNNKIFRVRDNQNHTYTIYNENNVALITVSHNTLTNQIILESIDSKKETEQLLCGVTTSAVGYALGTAAALTGPVGWAYVISWATISYFICK